MTSYRDVPELLEEYMDRCGVSEQWITAKEFRDFFRRIHHWPYFSCPYIVARIEKTVEYTPQPRPVNHYYVIRRTEVPGEQRNNQQVSQREHIACR